MAQDCYVEYIGDFVKRAILRALSPSGRLVVDAPDSGRRGGGGHIGYFAEPTAWRHLDPELRDALHLVLRSGRRQVAALEEAALIPDAIYFREVPG